MPLPTDLVQNARTFRQCAKDPLGTIYHEQTWMTDSGAVTFSIARDRESLVGYLHAAAAAINALRERGPVFHNGLVFGAVAAGRLVPHQLLAMPARGFGWSYDGFGDMPFSALKSGGYRPNEAKEWGTQDVLLDSIDEVRRVLGLEAVKKPDAPVKSAASKTAGKFTQVVRRLILTL